MFFIRCLVHLDPVAAVQRACGGSSRCSRQIATPKRQYCQTLGYKTQNFNCNRNFQTNCFLQLATSKAKEKAIAILWTPILYRLRFEVYLFWIVKQRGLNGWQRGSRSRRDNNAKEKRSSVGICVTPADKAAATVIAIQNSLVQFLQKNLSLSFSNCFRQS